MNFKKILIPILIFALSFSLVSCSKSEEPDYAVKVGNATVDEAIFAYYLDQQIKTGEQDISKEVAIENAESLCAHYIEINTEFEKRDLKLSSGEKSAIAEEVEDIWGLYSKYYKNIGVEKTDITKVKTSEAYEDALIKSIYGEGGEKEISAETQKTYFNNNYIFFKAINGYFTGDEDEDKETKETSSKLKSKITTEVTIDTVNMEYVNSLGGATGDAMEVSVLKKDSETYPEGFFDSVKALDVGDNTLLTYDTCIFVVEKCDGDDYYNSYETSILNDLALEDFTSLITQSYAKTKVSGTSSIENSVYKTIAKIKSK